MLTGAVLMLLWAVRRIRRVALAPVPGEGSALRCGTSAQATPALPGRWWPWHRAIRPVTGSPIVWKELRRPIFPRGCRGIFNALGLIAAGCVVVGSLVFLLVNSKLMVGPACIAVAALLQLLFVINIATSAASAITREKEARTLPILLTVPLDNGAIIRGKALGLLRRNLPLLVPVPILGALAYGLMSMSTEIMPSRSLSTIVSLEVSAVGNVVLLLGLGLCLSVYLRTTTSAVVSTFVVYIAFRFAVGIVVTILFMVAERFGVISRNQIFVRYAMVGLQVAVFGGLGLLLACIAAAGLRRNSL